MNHNPSIFWTLLLVFFGISLASCDDDTPPVENEEEVISKVVLTFTPTSTGAPLTFTYTDPIGDSPSPITLRQNTPYRLDIGLFGPNDENITEEIQAESDEHMFFFGWTEGLFANPTGNGNIDAREEGAVIYNDEDVNGLPLGLSTLWQTGAATTTANNTFRIVLKHQPGTKTATSTVNDGESDLDITLPITIVE